MSKYDKRENRRWQNSLPRKPIGTAVMFWDTAGRVLAVKPNYRDEWNLPGGVVDESESPLDAAVREVKEELGISISRHNLKLAALNYTPEQDGFCDFLAVIFDGGVLSEQQIKSITLQQAELDEMRFVTVESCKDMLTDVKARSVVAARDKTPAFLTAKGVLQ